MITNQRTYLDSNYKILKSLHFMFLIILLINWFGIFFTYNNLNIDGMDKIFEAFVITFKTGVWFFLGLTILKFYYYFNYIRGVKK